jgi:hypothetical protein
MNKKCMILLIVGLVGLLVITACAKKSEVRPINEIKTSGYLGKTVIVHGTVENNVNIGRISGFRLKDSTDSIPVSSKNLPKVDSEITVTGTLLNSSYFGLYIQVDEPSK